MGYTSMHDTGLPVRELLERECGKTFDAFGGRGREYYAAHGGFCTVFLVDYRKTARGRDIAYKVIGEGSHPYYYDVPARVWTKLTPLPDAKEWDSAREWRAKVEARKISYAPGTRLKLSGLVHWDGLNIHTDELVVADWKKKHFRVNGILVRCTSVQYYNPTVLEAP